MTPPLGHSKLPRSSRPHWPASTSTWAWLTTARKITAEPFGTYRRSYGLTPGNYQARYLKNMCHFVLDEYQPAVDTLEPLAPQQPDDLDLLFVLGICYGKLKRTAESEKAFARLIETGGDSPHMHLLLGKAYLDLYENNKAQSELEKAVAGDTKLPYAHFNLGVVYQRLGKLDEAVKEFDQEIGVSPREPWSYYESRGTIYLDQGDADHAIPLFEKALALNPIAALVGRARQGVRPQVKAGRGDCLPQAGSGTPARQCTKIKRPS